MSLFHKQRDLSEILQDPRTPYMIGQLLGSNKMAVALLRKEENETAKTVADVLDQVSAYFYTQVVQKKSSDVGGWEPNAGDA